MRQLLTHPAAKPLVFLLCLLPFAWLAYNVAHQQPGCQPAEALIRSTGDWTLRFFCIVLAVTPLANYQQNAGVGAFSAHVGLVCLLLRGDSPAQLQLV